MKEALEGPICWIESAGTNVLSVPICVTPAPVRSDPPTTLIATAARCELSDFRCAVTMMSASPVGDAVCADAVLAELCSLVAGVWTCAQAPLAVAHATMAVVVIKIERMRIPP